MLFRLRATGKFKSIFGNFGARRPTNMTNILTTKERRKDPTALFKTILGMGQTGKKPSGLPAASRL